MLRWIGILAALGLSACGPRENADVAQDCARSVTHSVQWSRVDAPDVITASSHGPSCAQATTDLTIRDASGASLWTFSSAYWDLAVGGPAPEDAEVSAEQIDAFLRLWADVSVSRTSTLPQWRTDAATLTESASVFSYQTPFDRSAYEALRQQDLTMLCYAAAVEDTQCIILNPATRTPTLIVAYGT